ncbi:adenine nucleotide alpha hydrolase family protein [Portibacter lacus]|uniref:Universal stress protein n=1 Tax=Portibacter lacus TaxID=1099794 RepID=A0AA37SM60_9BACT|nr:hypothetical protein [Portibacter lacus]GLR15594.1 hypothetical protein GCM10007940_02090 [Portibacter lacus]
MKKGILIVFDLRKQYDGYLNYVIKIASEFSLPINLVHCYPKADYNRHFSFPNKSYGEGILKLLKKALEPFQESIKAGSVNVKYLAYQGSEVEAVQALSAKYDFVTFETQIYKNTFTKFLNSKIAYLTIASQCPLLVIPPKVQFNGLNSLWLIARRDNDLEKLKADLKLLKVDSDKITVHHYEEKKHTSNLWRRMSTVMGITAGGKLDFDIEMLEKEHIDMLFLVGYNQNAFQVFLGTKLMKTIFSMGIPLMIHHEVEI